MLYPYIGPNGKKIFSEKRLSDADLEAAFAMPITEHIQHTEPTRSYLQRIVGVPPPGDVPKVSEDPDVQRRFAGQQTQMRRTAEFGMRAVPTAMRMGGLFGGPLVGGASEVGAETFEKATGQREAYSPGEIALQSTLSGVFKYAPALIESERALYGYLKGAVFGGTTATIDSMVKTGHLPEPGQIAFGASFGGAAGAGGSLLRNYLLEFADPETASVAHDLLSGKAPKGTATEVASESAAVSAPEIKQMTLDLNIPKAQRRSLAIKFKRGSQYYRPPGRGKPYQGSTLRELGVRGRGRESEFVPPAADPFPRREPEAPVGMEELAFPPRVREPIEAAAGFQIERGQAFYHKERFRQLLKAPWKWDIDVFRSAVPATTFDHIQQTTGVPVYDDVYVKGMNAYEHAENGTHAILEDTHPTVPITPEGNKRAQAYIETPQSHRPEIAKAMKMSSAEINAAERRRIGYQRIQQYTGLDMEEFMTEHVPHIRKTAEGFKATPENEGDLINEAFPAGVPKSVAYFRKYFNEDGILFDETDSGAMLEQFARSASRKVHMDPWEQDVRKLYERGVGGQMLPESTKRHVNRFVNELTGKPDEMKQALGSLITNLVNKIPGMHVKTQTIAGWVNDSIGLQYAATLGGRTGPIINNAVQPIQNAYVYVGNFIKNGMHEAYTQEGMRLGEEMGLIGRGGGRAREYEAALAESGGPTKAGPVRRGLRTFIRKSLALYGHIDDRNRVASGLAALRKAEWADRKAGGTATRNVARFSDLADLGLLRKSEKQAIEGLYSQGNKMEAFRRYAIAVADDSQYPYKPGTRPQIISGTYGKLFGAFAYWPMYYADQLNRIIQLPEKRGLALARFIGVNAALVGAFGAGGDIMGVDHPYKRQMGRFFLGPMGYTGSPPIETMFAITRSVNELVSLQAGGPGQKQLYRTMKAYIPNSYFVNDWMKLFAGDPNSIARMIGLAPPLPGLRPGRTQ